MPSNGPSVAGRPADVRSLALTVLAAVAVIVMLKYAQAVIIPIVLGVLISYALEPLVVALTRLRIVRPLAAAVVLVSVVCGAGTLLYQLRGQATDILQQLPAAARRLRTTIERDGAGMTSPIEQVQKAASELEKAADAAAPPPSSRATRVQMERPPLEIGDYLIWGSLSAGAAAIQLVLVVFLAYFLMASGNLYHRKLVKIAGPPLASKRVTGQILEDINHQIERFLIVLVFTSAVVGVATWLVFQWIGLQQAAFWGLLAGLFNSIPYFGPVIVTGGTAVVAFLQFGSLQMTLLVGGAALAITTIEGWLLLPWLTGRAAHMNAIAVFVGLLFWGWVWGVWGALLAVPMLMIVKAVCDRVENLKAVAELLGE